MKRGVKGVLNPFFIVSRLINGGILRCTARLLGRVRISTLPSKVLVRLVYLVSKPKKGENSLRRYSCALSCLYFPTAIFCRRLDLLGSKKKKVSQILAIDNTIYQG